MQEMVLCREWMGGERCEGVCSRSSKVSEELYSTHSGFYELPGICQLFMCDVA